MSSPRLTELVAEITAAREIILPQIEGLHDFSRLNLKEETKTKVQEATTDFERRRDRLNEALVALARLSEDGYPTVANRDVLQGVYNDLAENVATIDAAFAKFSPVPEAVLATITAGTPEQKPATP